MSDIPNLLAEALRNGEVKDRDSFYRLKMKLCSKLKPDKVPPNSEIIVLLTPEERRRYGPIIAKKPVKDVTGIAAVAVMTSPYPCPHGKCIYCPGGVANKSSQSYTGKEPSARRAEDNRFDPYDQVVSRIKQMEDTGHDTSRVELIIMGGTFTSRSKQYRDWFVKRCFDALNGFDQKSLEDAIEKNSSAVNKVVSLTVETRPDYFTEPEQIIEMMKLGATRVELGVQILDDKILEKVERGHGIEEVIKATRACRDAGLSICYHLMPGLPGSSPKHDLECFKKVFDDPSFRPDNLKFYPVLVVGNTKLREMWENGEYSPPDEESTIQLLQKIKEEIPPYARIQRIQRDIPVPEIVQGITSSNMRQLVQDYMEKNGMKCNCIRCREAGRTGAEPQDPNGDPNDLIYEASGGTEHFISYEPDGALVAYIRLRICGNERAVIRELKITGNGIDGDSDRGYGEELIRFAEKIAKKEKIPEIEAVCGPGLRGIYSELGYSYEFPYMKKTL